MRVLGEIKSFNSKRTVTAGAITVLTDHNEYLYHQLDVIYTHLELTKGKVRRVPLPPHPAGHCHCLRARHRA